MIVGDEAGDAARSVHGHHRPGVERTSRVAVAVSAGARAYLGARAAEPLGDMMIDGVPRGARCAAAQSFEAVQRECWQQCLFGNGLHGIRGLAGRSRRRPRRGSRDRREGVVAEGA
jgi:hypothetical protein